MIRDRLHRLRWWYFGEIASVVVEEYDDPTDAVLYPVIGAMITVGMWIGAVVLMQHSALEYTAGLLLAALAIADTVHLAVAISATVTYALEPTEVDHYPEVTER